MTMSCWNISGNGGKRWKFYSEVHSTLPTIESSATTSSIGLKKQEWSWWTNGKLKEISLMPTEMRLRGILLLFEEHVLPKSNALIMIVEIKETVPGFHKSGGFPY